MSRTVEIRRALQDQPEEGRRLLFEAWNDPAFEEKGWAAYLIGRLAHADGQPEEALNWFLFAVQHGEGNLVETIEHATSLGRADAVDYCFQLWVNSAPGLRELDLAELALNQGREELVRSRLEGRPLELYNPSHGCRHARLLLRVGLVEDAARAWDQASTVQAHDDPEVREARAEAAAEWGEQMRQVGWLSAAETADRRLLELRGAGVGEPAAAEASTAAQPPVAPVTREQAFRGFLERGLSGRGIDEANALWDAHRLAMQLRQYSVAVSLAQLACLTYPDGTTGERQWDRLAYALYRRGWFEHALDACRVQEEPAFGLRWLELDVLRALWRDEEADAAEQRLRTEIESGGAFDLLNARVERLDEGEGNAGGLPLALPVTIDGAPAPARARSGIALLPIDDLVRQQRSRDRDPGVLKLPAGVAPWGEPGQIEGLEPVVPAQHEIIARHHELWAATTATNQRDQPD